MKNWKELEAKLKVGTKIKIGDKYIKEIGGFESGEVITLIEGYFDYENGLYVTQQTAPAIWDDAALDYDSIYHLFGNHLEYFLDCEVIE